MCLDSPKSTDFDSPQRRFLERALAVVRIVIVTYCVLIAPLLALFWALFTFWGLDLGQEWSFLFIVKALFSVLLAGILSRIWRTGFDRLLDKFHTILVNLDHILPEDRSKWQGITPCPPQDPRAAA